MPRSRVVVTGAAGFVGRHLVDRLVSGGHEVLGLVRSNPPPARPGVRFVARDLTAQSSVSDLLRRGDTLVHLAARVHVMRDTVTDQMAAYRAANVAPLCMLCESSISAGVANFIFLSSAKVYGESGPAPFTADDAPRPADPYARSKVEGEHLLRSAGAQGSFPWTIVRPPFVYGPGAKGNFPRLLQLARVAATIPLPLGGIRNARSIIFVGNLADAIYHCVVNPAARNRVLLPTDSRTVSTPELLHAIAAVRGQRARLFNAPLSWLRIAARLAGRVPELDRLVETLTLDGTATQRQLGWVPPFSLEEALRLSLAASPESDSRRA